MDRSDTMLQLNKNTENTLQTLIFKMEVDYLTPCIFAYVHFIPAFSATHNLSPPSTSLPPTLFIIDLSLEKQISPIMLYPM